MHKRMLPDLRLENTKKKKKRKESQIRRISGPSLRKEKRDAA